MIPSPFYRCDRRLAKATTRRQFIWQIISGSTVIPFWLATLQSVKSETLAKALVLSCIDFRFVSMEQNFLKQQQLEMQYDWLSLAGASLALANFPSTAETQTFWEQLELSVSLHQISQVIIVDHQDCGAYANKIDPHLSNNPQQERQIHRQYLTQAAQEINQRYPLLKVELYFALLNGEVEKISFV